MYSNHLYRFYRRKRHDPFVRKITFMILAFLAVYILSQLGFSVSFLRHHEQDKQVFYISKWLTEKQLDKQSNGVNRSMPLLNNTVRTITIQEKHRYLALPHDRKYKAHVAIVTRMQDSVEQLRIFVHSLHQLKYRRNLVSVYFADDGSLDGTAEVAKQFAINLVVKDGFRYAKVVELNLISGHFGLPNVIQANAMERKRMGHIARVRNEMLEVLLMDEDWILWLDIGVTSLPTDLIEQFLFAGKDIMAASCLRKGIHGFNVIADLHSWRETETSWAIQESLSTDQLMLEGYWSTYRTYLPHLRDLGRLVHIDGVGGCALMVNATCHLKGLKFPEEVYHHHIDTEGLAKLAVYMGYGVYGLPYLEVFL